MDLKKTSTKTQLNIIVLSCSGLKEQAEGEPNNRNVQVQLQVEDLFAATKVVSSGLSPTFDEKFSVVLSSTSDPTLFVVVVSKNSEGKDEFLGQVKINLGLIRDHQMKEKNYPLERQSFNQEVKGEIRLKIEYTENITMDPDELATFKKSEQSKARKGEILEYYMKEMEKLRSVGTELKKRVEQAEPEIKTLSVKLEKTEQTLQKMTGGKVALEKISKLEKEKKDLQELYKKLNQQANVYSEELRKKDKEIMKLEHMSQQKNRMVVKMSLQVAPQAPVAAAPVQQEEISAALSGMGPSATQEQDEDEEESEEEDDLDELLLQQREKEEREREAREEKERKEREEKEEREKEEKEEKERLEREEREEKERIEKEEKEEKERLEKEEKERIEREKKEKEELERLENESKTQQEREEIEKERKRIENERIEKERIEREERERERKERKEKERKEREEKRRKEREEREEKKRIEKEERERIEAEIRAKAAAERAALEEKRKKNLPKVWKKKFKKEKQAKEDWKKKSLELEQLYNEMVEIRQREAEEEKNQTKILEEIELLKQLNSDLDIELRMTESQIEEVMKKYKKEAKDRKKLYNDLQELKGNIRVYCRCRPISEQEISRGAVDVTAFGDLDDVTIFTENGKKTFEFDANFDPDSTQEQVFIDTQPLMLSVLDGFNVCIFAYGQTGSGKTFTMQGTEANPGVNVRALNELFSLVKQRGSDYSFEMKISILEIYCDQIRDLLEPGDEKLNVKQERLGNRTRNYVDGLSQRVVNSVNEVKEIIELSNKNRSVASTNMNQHSSRSHLVMTVEAISVDKLTGKSTRASLHMVDLAGSERVGRSGVVGQALKEAQSINQSLSALGNVLSALGRKDGHIPYRNSKLTHVLADALGGNSKVLMFCNISPSSDNVSETLSSLLFASRARSVELGKATANVSPATAAVTEVPAELADEEETQAPATKVPSVATSSSTAKPALGAKPAVGSFSKPATAAAPARPAVGAAAARPAVGAARPAVGATTAAAARPAVGAAAARPAVGARTTTTPAAAATTPAATSTSPATSPSIAARRGITPAKK